MVRLWLIWNSIYRPGWPWFEVTENGLPPPPQLPVLGLTTPIYPVCVCTPEDNPGYHPQHRCPPRLRQGLSLVWGSPVTLGWLTSETQGSACLCPTDAVVSSESHCAQLFHAGCRDLAGVLCWPGKHFRAAFPSIAGAVFYYCYGYPSGLWHLSRTSDYMSPIPDSRV